MAGIALSLPIDIPWKLIAASPDMMDTEFCNKRFPFAWRSSLALFAFEPKLEDLPEESCGERTTYIKVTCTISGYQLSKEETDSIYVSYPDIPTEDLELLIGEYFACYGALLNAAVFPCSDRIKELKQVRCDFGPQAPGTVLSNPYDCEQAIFRTPSPLTHVVENRIVDLYPAGGDQSGELDLREEMTVTIPVSTRVEAAVVHDEAATVTMTAFSGNQPLASKKAGPDAGVVHSLVIEANDIDRIVFTVTNGQASLLTFTYWRWQERPVELKDYPHIVDFEPKVRDLYQAATEQAEVLTASISKVTTGKALTHTDSTQTGLSLGAKYAPKVKDPNTGAEVSGSELSASLSHQWGQTDQDTSTVQVDASRERRENQGTTTSLSQMYNLLTGYHAGTNRASFLMLARPHVLQPTDHRTFIHGLRIIEGIQDFFLIVTRPRGMESFCVETFLETGHFPEDVDINVPETKYETKTKDFDVQQTAAGGWTAIASRPFSGFEVDRWEFDPNKGTTGSGGVEEIKKYDDDNADEPKGYNGWSENAMRDYSYGATSPDQVIIKGDIQSHYTSNTKFHRQFRVYLRRPEEVTSGPKADYTKLLIAARGLCACMKPTNGCLEPIPYVMEPVEGYEDFTVSADARWRLFGLNCTDIDYIYTIKPGAEIDRSKGDAQHPGVAELQDRSNPQARNSLTRYDYRIISDRTATVTGEICATVQSVAHFERAYRIFTRTYRARCGSDVRISPLPPRPIGDFIVDEQRIAISPALYTRDTVAQSRLPAMKQLLHQIQVAMTTSWRLPSRAEFGRLRYTDTDYFNNRIQKLLPDNVLRTRLTEMPTFRRGAIERLGMPETLGDVLKLDLTDLAHKAGLSISEAASLRSRLLREAAKRQPTEPGE